MDHLEQDWEHILQHNADGRPAGAAGGGRRVGRPVI